LTESIPKEYFEIWKKTNQLTKDQVIDKIIKILDESDSMDFVESSQVIDLFKKMNGRKYNIGTGLHDVLLGYGYAEKDLMKITGKEYPAVRGNKK
jgi:hypothetical protein